MMAKSDDNLENSSEGWADLHIHSTASDGLFSPKKIVKLAVEQQLRAISITDHDAIKGIIPALKIASAYNLEVIPGIELSTLDKQHDIHILGYFVDIDNQQIQHYIKLFQEERLRRAKKIVRKLHDMGLRINMNLILQKAGTGAIGRPHIADVLMEEGFVLSYDEAFYKFLGDGKPAFVPKYKISPEKGIELIHQAGGLSFIAHPGTDIKTDDLVQFIKKGLDGIEILHPKHTQEKVNELYQFAIQYGLLVSGGSDCHGERKGDTTIGLYNVPYQFVEDMKQKLEIMQDIQSISLPNLNK